MKRKGSFIADRIDWENRKAEHMKRKIEAKKAREAKEKKEKEG